MSGSLWSVVIAHERQRQDDSHQTYVMINYKELEMARGNKMEQDFFQARCRFTEGNKD